MSFPFIAADLQLSIKVFGTDRDLSVCPKSFYRELQLCSYSIHNHAKIGARHHGTVCIILLQSVALMAMQQKNRFYIASPFVLWYVSNVTNKLLSDTITLLQIVSH
jgi:hypothetical protein